jgi:Pentapeptide repeats (9 copies)
VAGVWQLNEFWGTDEDQKLVASVLAAELTLPDDYRLVRCAAAEVIGNAESAVAKKENPDKERQTLVRILYGNKDGEIGLVEHQHLLLRATYFGPTDAWGYSNTPDPKASNNCATALDASREAIRLSWAYLHEVNLNGTDLSQIQLYEADLAGASLRSAYLNHANFKCANLSHADFEGAHWDTADFSFANVTGSKPDKFRDYARAHGALPDTTDADCVKWRDNGFRVSKKGSVLFDSANGMECGTGHPADKK